MHNVPNQSNISLDVTWYKISSCQKEMRQQNPYSQNQNEQICLYIHPCQVSYEDY